MLTHSEEGKRGAEEKAVLEGGGGVLELRTGRPASETNDAPSTCFTFPTKSGPVSWVLTWKPGGFLEVMEFQDG